MGINKEINIYTNGDPAKLETFSNVPFFFIKTLKEKGIKVNAIDISPIARWGRIWNRYALRILKIFFPKTTYSYDRTWINEISTRIKIKKAVELYPKADLHIFLTYIANTRGLINRPCILVSDWNYEFVITNFWDSVPDFFQNFAITRQNKIMQDSDFIFSLFPGSTSWIKEKYNKSGIKLNPKIYQFRNFLNSLENPVEEGIIKRKIESKSLLFIGKNHYLKGAVSLIKAFQKLKIEDPEWELHIIGLKEQDFPPGINGIIFHGYLNKEITRERLLFYQLLTKATVFINTNPRWGAYSSTLEAMNFYTPVLVSRYDEFESNFGEELDFGYYVRLNESHLIYDKIMSIVRQPTYHQLCLNAHEKVKDFTWNNAMDDFFKKINYTLN